MFQSTADVRSAVRTRGTLDGWQAVVAMPCSGNHRLVLGICAAFAAPMLRLMEAEGFGIHFCGPSSLGKTMLLRVAGSVWGGGSHGYLQSWQATANGIEAMAEAHNDVLLCLDEIGLVKPETAASVAYGLAQGLGRTRALKNGQGAPRLEWRIVFLSTGEMTLADKLREARAPQRLMAGQEVRFLNIQADAKQGYGIFDMAPPMPGETQESSGKRLSDSLASASAQHYGTAGPAFVEALASDRDALVQQAKELARAFAEGIAGDAGSQAQRVASRFGLIAASGELAITLGIVPWQAGDAIEAAKVGYRAWTGERGGTVDSETTEATAHLRAVIERDGASRFQRIGEPNHVVHDRLGYVRTGETGTYYLILPEAWKSIMSGRDPRRVAQVIGDKGILVRGTDGRDTRKERVAGSDHPQRVFVVSHATLFADGADNVHGEVANG